MSSQYDGDFDGFDEFMLDDDDTETTLGNLYLVIELSDVKYALKAENIKEIVIIPNITPLPEAGNDIRGVIKLRNNVITLIDMRKRLGFMTLDDADRELIQNFADRKQEHINWISELTASIEENREFKLTTDPHACAFGRWYDNFKTSNIGFSIFMKQFDMPHKIIHSVAHKALKARSEQGLEAARKIIADTRQNEMNTLLKLFDDVKDVLRQSHRELAIIVDDKGSLVALSADSVDKIVKIDDADIQKSSAKNTSRWIRGSYSSGDEVYFMLDDENITDF